MRTDHRLTTRTPTSWDTAPRAYSKREAGMGGDKVIYRLMIVLLAACAFVGWAFWYSENRNNDDSASPMAEQLQEFSDAIENAPPCTEVFAPGRPTADVLADNDTGPCTQPDGEALFNVVVSWDCPDGRTVSQIDNQGWGFSDDVWQGPDVREPYADCVMPGTDDQHP